MMDLKTLNKVLGDLEKLRNGKPFSREVEKTCRGDYSNQGEEGLWYEVYRVDEFYIKLTIKTDSYGDNERISGIQFVEPTTKTVTVYESVK